MALRTTIKRKWSQELNYRIKSLLLACCTTQGLVATDTQYRCKLTAIGTDNIVVHIPGLHTESLTLIHRRPRLRCLECCDIEQTLIDNSERVAHRLAIRLAYLDGKLLLRTNLRRHIYYRVQNCLAVNNLCPLYTVHSYRQVVYGLGVWLQQCGVDIEVRCHIAGNEHTMRSLLVCRCAYPLARDYSRAILYRQQYATTFRFRQIDSSVFANLIVTLVKRE